MPTIHDRMFWEEMCKQNGHSWIFTHNTWLQYWVNTSNFRGTNLLVDPERRGFIFYIEPEDPDDPISLYFALVDICHRGKGVLSAMMKRFEEKFKRRKIILEVVVDISPIDIWKHYGFTSRVARYATVPSYTLGEHIIMEKQL